jgi:Sec-independent protein translocase protein TatA
MTLAIIFESVGVGEWFLLLAVVLIVVGPKNLPSTIRKFGNYYSKFRRAAESFKRQLMEMDTEINNVIKDAEKEVESAVSIPEAEYSPADGAEAYGREFDDAEAGYPGGDYMEEDYYGAGGYHGEVEETGESASDDGGGTEPDVTVAASAENSGENDGDKKTTAES